MPASFFHPKNASLLMLLAALGVLGTVFALQYLGGYPPCRMCIWQRWPFAVLAVLGLIGAFAWPRQMLTLALLAMLVSIGLGSYHLAVEQGWIALPAGCAAGGDASSVEELKAMLKAAPPSCDQVGFSVLGLSLAAWNVVGSTLLAIFTAIVLTSSRRQASYMAHQT